MIVDPKIYPKAKYHATLPPALANNPEEEKQMGKDWFDHPDLALEAATSPSVHSPLSTDSPALSTLPSAKDLDLDAEEKKVVEATDKKVKPNAPATVTA